MCLLKQCPNDWSSDTVSCIGKSAGISFSYFTANQGLTFHPGGKEGGVGLECLVGPKVAYRGMQSIWLLY